jgi:hypothetical protein
MKLSPLTLWQRLSRAHADSRSTAADETAPYGFATRVVATWRAMDRDARFQFWRSWSLRAALAAFVVCAVLAVAERSQTAMASGPQPIQVPSLPLPALP